MTLLRTSLAAGSLLLLGVGTASAADLGGPRGSLKDSGPAEYFSACGGERFNGFYGGVTVGQTRVANRWNEKLVEATNNPGVQEFNDYQAFPLDSSRSGLTAGGTLGFNRVRCNFLIGVESDISFGSIGGATNIFSPFNATTTEHLTVNDHMKGFATLRGRMGVIANQTLFFATGGLAWANLEHKLGDFRHIDPAVADTQLSGWKMGWALGAGFEHALTNAISLKGEVLHMDFGSRTYTKTDTGSNHPITGLPGLDIYTFQTKTNVTTARVGLNFKFGASGNEGCGDCGPRK